MNYYTFKSKVCNNIKHYLPESYSSATVKVTTVRKLNEAYDGLQVILSDTDLLPVINLNHAYDFCLGNGFNKTMDCIAKEILCAIPDSLRIPIENYESGIKEKLFIRMSNALDNQEFLKGVPHKIVNDLAITYHILLDTEGDEYKTTTITNDLLDTFGVSQDVLHNDAVRNSQRIFPVLIEPLVSILNQSGFPIHTDTDAIVVSNSCLFNGASAIMYPGVIENIAQKLGDRFFMFPSSIPEVICMKYDDRFTSDYLNDLVCDINERTLKKEEVLSNHIYQYSIRQNELVSV